MQATPDKGLFKIRKLRCQSRYFGTLSHGHKEICAKCPYEVGCILFICQDDWVVPPTRKSQGMANTLAKSLSVT